MAICDKTFDELSSRELYEILRARNDVFVVEQKCPYEDIDGVDYESRHVFLKDESGRVQAYLRYFPRPGEPGVVQLGRVLTRERGTGLGMTILAAGIESARGNPGITAIYIEAQTYAIRFYERAGFAVAGEEFPEDGIPHIPMRLVFGQ